MDADTSTQTGHIQPLRADIVDELARLGLSRETLTALEPALAATRLANYKLGETLFHAGADADTLYVTRHGRIKLLTHLETGRARIVRLHKRGSIIGLNGLLDEQHAHTAIAIDHVQVYQIPMRQIKAVTNNDTDVYSELLEHWHAYLQMADTWITDFSTGAIRGRVARLLLYLIETSEETGPSEVVLLTVEEMAEILGVTPESVSRVMAEMKRNRILQHVNNEAVERYMCDIRKLEKASDL